MATGISLANKSQLLFGVAVVLILGGALSVPWFWTQSMVRETQLEVLRASADTWWDSYVDRNQMAGEAAPAGDVPLDYSIEFDDPVRVNLVDVRAIERLGNSDAFLVRALDRFREDPALEEYVRDERIEGLDVYHFARPIRESQLPLVGRTEEGAASASSASDDPVRAILQIDRRTEFASGQLLVSRIYIVAAWLFASLLAILVFYLILTKLIFSPVRRLRETAGKIESGELSARAQIRTGDEFEQLSEAFNNMLERLAEGQRKLRSMNETLDLRLSELAEANFALFESNRLKGEFLASVSHELRTPLNSIIGFSELLDEMARTDEHADPKRRRYLNNILTSARSLLEMINDLLEMAKIEAGRVELNIESTNVTDLVEGLEALMRPQAEARRVTIETNVSRNLPTIETDAGKLQQVLYNFLSNAIKFSPEGEKVTITAERAVRPDRVQTVRLGVIDRGPGIPPDLQDMIFEKFRQADASHTKEHKGVGLGLAICRELADLLSASLSVVSEPGAGSAFYVEVPVTYEPPKPKPLMERPDGVAFDGERRTDRSPRSPIAR